MKLHLALARALADYGADTMFGVVGDTNLFFVHSFVHEASGRFVAAATESGAALMAGGYAGASGELGVVTVTCGPGLTNTLTGLVDAVKGRLPVLVVCGDTAAEARFHDQNVPQRELIVATGAGFQQVEAAHTALDDLAIAIRRAHLERRPVALNVPKGLMEAELEYHQVGIRLARPAVPQIDEASLDIAIGIVASARRPVVVAGRGAAGARADLLRLAERLGAPVATSLGGKDLFHGDPFDLGIMGTLSGEGALKALAEADCVLAFGAGMNEHTTAHGSLVAGKALVHCDIDPHRLGYFTGADAMVLGDAGQVARAMIEWLDLAGVPATSFRSAARALEPSADRDAVAEPAVTAGTVDIRFALRQIDAAVPAHRLLVTDPGRHLAASWTELHVEQPRDFVTTAHFGGIGSGMAAAIGAACARPDRPVLMAGGDGGFMLGGLSEFSTAVRHRLDLIAVICNDGAYGAEHMLLVDRDVDAAITQFDWPDLGPVAEALGGRGITVRTPEDVDRALTQIAVRDRPLLIDIKLDPFRMPEVPH